MAAGTATEAQDTTFPPVDPDRAQAAITQLHQVIQDTTRSIKALSELNDQPNANLSHYAMLFHGVYSSACDCLAVVTEYGNELYHREVRIACDGFDDMHRSCQPGGWAREFERLQHSMYRIGVMSRKARDAIREFLARQVITSLLFLLSDPNLLHAMGYDEFGVAYASYLDSEDETQEDDDDIEEEWYTDADEEDNAQEDDGIDDEWYSDVEADEPMNMNEE